ncbi:hypothetical protein GCM10023063_27670 [Arthrobacter methylotrophus]|uniref:non-specific serine/threonine protein kinase n=1 Tax=Arthrobacter methylotrophus TaxID=121291 RepID=A0ABV5UT53_9MICC
METFASGKGDQDDEKDEKDDEKDEKAGAAPGTGGSEPVIPGFVPVRELGRGGSAVVWLAVDQRSGDGFAVKCIARETETEEPGEATTPVLREVQLQSRLDHEHLVKVRGVVTLSGAYDGGLGLVMDYAPGGSLGQLVSSRGRLGVGETVTILAPLAQALAYLHHQGMTHSDVSPGNVLFTAQGKPLLSDLGISRIVGDATGAPDAGTPGFVDPAPIAGQRAELQPERDTYALAALGWYCLTGSAPGAPARRPPLTLLVPEVPAPLAVAIEAGLHPEVSQRPSASELGTAVYRSSAPEPVDLSVSVHATVIPELLTRRRASGPRPRRTRVAAFFGRFRSPRGGREGRRAVSLLSARRRAASMLFTVGILVAVGSAITVWWAGERGQGVEQQTPTPAPSGLEGQPGNTPLPADVRGLPDGVQRQIQSPDPEEALRGLSALRDVAFNSGRLELLEHVNAQGSVAAAADTKTRDELQGGGLVLAGFSTTLTSVRLEDAPSSEHATVAVTVEASAYAEQDSTGKMLRSRPPGKPQELRVVLQRFEGAWRIKDILAKKD